MPSSSSIPFWLGLSAHWTGRQAQGGQRVGMPGIKWSDVISKIFCNTQLIRLNTCDDAPGQFISAIGVEMGVVFEFLVLSRKSSGRVVHKCLDSPFRSHGFKQLLAHGIQVNQRNILFLGQFAHSFRIVTKGIHDLSFRVEVTAMHGSYQHWNCISLAGFVNIELESFFVSSEWVHMRPTRLLVIVGKLYEKIIARLDGLQDLLEPPFSDEAFQRLS